MPSLHALILPSQQYGRLTVLQSFGGYTRCQCACGGTTIVRNDRLRSGKTRSCGCLAREMNEAAKKPKPAPAPRRTRTPTEKKLAAVYWAMVDRCNNPKNKDYVRYGARGIDVCVRWQGSVDTFIMDMLPTYRAGLWLERVDNDLGYSPDNCVFRTPFKQACNRRNSLVFPNGVHFPTWCRLHALDYQRAYLAFSKLRASLGRTPLQSEVLLSLASFPRRW